MCSEEWMKPDGLKLFRYIIRMVIEFIYFRFIVNSVLLRIASWGEDCFNWKHYMRFWDSRSTLVNWKVLFQEIRFGKFEYLWMFFRYLVDLWFSIKKIEKLCISHSHLTQMGRQIKWIVNSNEWMVHVNTEWCESMKRFHRILSQLTRH